MPTSTPETLFVHPGAVGGVLPARPAPLVARLQRFQRVVSWFGAKEDMYRKQLGALVPECIVAPPVPEEDSPLTVWEHLADTLGPWGVSLPIELHHLPTAE